LVNSFFKACKNCTFDFIPLHWYGDFGGLASHLGEYTAAFPNMTFWFTEFAFDHQDVQPSQDFFNSSIEYFDRISNVERYTYFGSFRSNVANVGPNAAMLNQKGGLTWLGAWYLNKNENQAASETGTSGASTVGLSFVTLAVAGLVGAFAVL
jgi:hypothetical protein